MTDWPSIPAPTNVSQSAWDTAIAEIRGFCGWHIAPVIAGDVVRVRVAWPVVVLPSLEVQSVASVTIGDVVQADWVLMPEPVVYLAGCQWWWNDRPVVATVTMTHGYWTFPTELAQLGASLALRTSGNPLGALRQQAGPFSFAGSQTAPNQVVPSALLEAERNILSRYKLAPRP